MVDNYSATYLAAAKHNLAVLKLILQYGGDPNTYLDEREDQAALAEALHYGKTREYQQHDPKAWDEFNLLLTYDKDINHEDSIGRTIADEAALSGEYGIVGQLLLRGYNYELVDLGSYVQNSGRQSVTVANDPARLRGIELLKQKGVYFPVAPRPQRWARVKLQDDGMLDVHWGDLHSRHGTVDPNPDQIVHKGEPLYDQLIVRVGGLKPGETKHIERKPDDAAD